MRPAFDVVQPHDAGEGRARGVRGREDAEVIGVGEVHAVLRVDGRRLRGSVLAEALRRAQRERRERVVARLRGRRDADDPRLTERPVAGLELVAALGDAEVEERAAHDRGVPLPRIVRPLEDADAPHHFGDDEVDVRVALPVDVERDVEGDLADLHLDPRAVVEIEAAQIDVVAEALAVLVIDEEARRRRQHLARLLARRGGERLAVDADVAETPWRRPRDAPDLYVLHGRSRGVRRRRGGRGRWRRSGRRL